VKLTAVLLVVPCAALLACQPVAAGPDAGTGGGGPGSSVASAAGGTGSTRLATVVLAELPVKGRAPMTGYARSAFGSGWGDEDHDGCSTREEVLRRDLTGTTYRADGRCQVLQTGTLNDPYSGRVITFRRGAETSSDVQIDHVVALADAWQKGAQGWAPARREAFANDPVNLLAVDGPLNQGKGAGDAATWLPPHRSFRCGYVSRQVAVKASYGLWVTAAEKAAIARVLTACPGQRLPR
jgi:hypothetical protein